MRLHIVYDRDGRILAAAPEDAAAPVKVHPVFNPEHGERYAAVDVPKEYETEELSALCERLIVATHDKHPQLVASNFGAES